jgi:hypothetical protein
MPAMLGENDRNMLEKKAPVEHRLTGASPRMGYSQPL